MSWDASAAEALANPTGRSKDRMTLERCKQGLRGAAFVPIMDKTVGAGPGWGGRTSGQVILFSQGQDRIGAQ